MGINLCATGFKSVHMEYCRIVFNNRDITIDRMLMADFEKYYGKQLPDWRIENYIRQRVHDAVSNMDVILSGLSDVELSEIITSGLRNEVSAKEGFDDTAICMIENPYIDKRKYYPSSVF